MDWHVRAFIKASLTWLALGVTLGVAMAAHPVWTIYRLSHVHMMLLGFVTMMIYGVAYHVIPRFAGFPLHSRKVAVWHWWIANAGLALMAVGFALRARAVPWATHVLACGGVLSATGAYLFVFLLWRTMDGPSSLRTAAKRARLAAQGRPGKRAPLVTVAPSDGASTSAAR